MRLITSLSRFVRRLYLAIRFFVALNYSWHVAWIKAERGSK